jgi:hypothetical protein
MQIPSGQRRRFMTISRYWITLALVCSMLGCRKSPASHAVDAEAAAFLPADTIVLAGVDLDRLRTAPLYSKLPPAAAIVLGSIKAASSALLAYNGKDLTVIARGHFPQTPPGATLVAPNLVIFGSPVRSGANGATTLIALAEPIVTGRQIWMVVQGGAPLPLTGNAENLNHLIQNSESITMTANIDSGLDLAILALGRTDNSARTIEESFRAEVTLAAAAESRRPDLARLLKSIQIDRAGRTVRITLSTDAAAAVKLSELAR